MTRTDSTTGQARIAARYPRRSPAWRWRAIAIVLAVVGGTWLIWTALYHANPGVAGQVKSFEVLGDGEVRVVLTVERPDPGIVASCTLIAQSVNYLRVGELVVQIPPSTAKVVDSTVTIRTLNRATSASLQGCEIPR